MMSFYLFLFLGLVAGHPSPVHSNQGLVSARDSPKLHGNIYYARAANDSSDAANVTAAANSTDCVAAASLAVGIQSNIVAQTGEQNSTTAIQNFFAAGKDITNDSAEFLKLKQNLLAFVDEGIAIRQANQQIAPSGNAAVAGLATVATAQLTEQGLANNLTGIASIDSPNLSTLQTDFAGGIMQNQKNIQDALSGCT